ncbi:MAG TPA: thiamine phosphate synthase [Thermoanaerobaculia bacterium]|nr:thiamine phosphate synthase [Thermoanaerobaculia bacterium]
MSVNGGRRPWLPLEPLPRLYAIADVEALGAGAGDLDPVLEAVSMLAAVGVHWIQLRAKRLCGRDVFAMVEGCLDRLAGHPEVALWVDDRVDVAACLPVAGVHLGQLDLPPAGARRVLGADPWIGLSTHTIEQGRAGQSDSAVDVVAVGPIYATRSKGAPDRVVGLAGVEHARSLGRKPLIAIGGIDAERAPAVLAAGADSVAVIGALGRGSEIEPNARRLLAAVR